MKCEFFISPVPIYPDQQIRIIFSSQEISIQEFHQFPPNFKSMLFRGHQSKSKLTDSKLNMNDFTKFDTQSMSFMGFQA